MIARIAYVVLVGAPAMVATAALAAVLAGSVVGLRASFALLNVLPRIGGLGPAARRHADSAPAWLC